MVEKKRRLLLYFILLIKESNCSCIFSSFRSVVNKSKPKGIHHDSYGSSLHILREILFPTPKVTSEIHIPKKTQCLCHPDVYFWTKAYFISHMKDEDHF